MFKVGSDRGTLVHVPGSGVPQQHPAISAARGLDRGTSLPFIRSSAFLFSVKWIYRLYYLVLTKLPLPLTKGQVA